MVWFLAALVQVGLYVGTSILSALLNRSAKQESAPGEPQFPKADPTAPVPVVFGTTRVPINVIHKAKVVRGENSVRNGTLSLGWSKTKIGDFFYLDMAAVVCHGGVGAIHEVYVDKTKKLSTLPASRTPTLGVDGVTYTIPAAISPALPVYLGNGGPAQFTITAGELLGGKLSRGGIGAGGDTGSVGTMRFYPGNGWNVQNTRLETLHGGRLPNYPNLCWVAFESDFYFGNTPDLPAIEFVVTRPPTAPFLGTGLLGNVSANSAADASVAGIIWEILTNTTWGLGLPAAALDSSSFSALDTACNLGLDGYQLGLSFVLTAQVSAKQVLSDVLRTIDGVLYTDPETGLIGIWLLQSADGGTYGATVFNSYVLDDTVIKSVVWTETAPDAQANEVKVEFVDRARDFRQNTVTVRNVAAINALGRTESRTVSFLGVQDATLATRLAYRELRTISTTVGHATITCDRIGYRLTPGKFFVMQWDVAGKTSRTMRCVSQRDTPFGTCEIEAVEDVYASPDPSYAVETTPEPTPIGGTPTLTPYGYIEATLTGTTTGNTTLFLYDPTGEVTLVEYRTRSGAAAFSGWTTDTFPYQASVTLNGVADSAVEWRVTYTDAASVSQTLTFAHTFGVDTTTAQAIADAAQNAATTLGSIGIPTVFVNTTEDDQWLALSTIPTAETEVGAEFRRQRYLVGAGSVRFNANIKTLTGSPTVRLKYTTDAFGSTTAMLSWTPTGTGLQSSTFTSVPTGAKADVGLTVYVADGADTAAISFYELDAEFLPTTVASARIHTSDHAPEFY